MNTVAAVLPATRFPLAGPVPAAGGFRQEGYWVWCGSVLEEPGQGYHLYAARWPQDYPMFEGYLYLSEIVRAWSPTLAGPYRFAERVLPGGDPARWDGRMAHNPTVLRAGDRYLLYYIASTYDHAVPPPAALREHQAERDAIYRRIRIGLAVAATPAGPWRALAAPILTPRPGHWDAQVVTNPAPCLAPDGRIFLYYRSNTPAGLRLGLAIAARPEGPYRRVQEDPVLPGFDVEDPFVWHNGAHFEMLAKDMSGAITGERHAGAHFESPDGIHWQPATPAKAYSRSLRYDDGRTVTLGCLERPQLFFGADGRPACCFFAAGDGPGGFGAARHTWNLAWPLPS